MRRNIDAIFEKYFPTQWTAESVAVFATHSRFDVDVAALNESLNIPVRDLMLRGGKRIRPLLFLTLLKSFEKDPTEYLDFAFLVEMVHNGTLVVDDIEDGSDLRRGKPALHKAFGIDIGLNAGVSMHVLPLSLLVKQSIPEHIRLAIYDIYAQELTNVYLGQALDIYWHKEVPSTVTISNYLEMARLKTGSLARMAVRFATTLAEQPQATTDALTEFAESSGIAFQIKDDVLDLTTQAEVFGKPFGQDISEGKMSLPVVLALKELSSHDKRELQKILREHTTDKNRITKAQELITSTSAIDQSLERAEKLLTTAWSEAQAVVPEGEGRDLLQELTESFVTRVN